MTAKAAKPAQEFEKGQRGKKLCNFCSESIGARCTTCPKCGKELPVKAKTAGFPKGKGKGQTWDSLLDKLADLDLIKLQKDVDTLEGIQAQLDEASASVNALGGVETAKKLLDVASKLGTPGKKAAKK